MISAELLAEGEIAARELDPDPDKTWGGVALPIGPKVVPFWGSYLESYKVIPKKNYFGAYG